MKRTFDIQPLEEDLQALGFPIEEGADPNGIIKFVESKSWLKHTFTSGKTIAFYAKKYSRRGDDEPGYQDVDETERMERLVKSKFGKLIKSTSSEPEEEWGMLRIELK